MKKAKRPLAAITDDLRIALKREAADVINIGNLLDEAKATTGHGNFLPWIEHEFSMSKRTAQRYMAVFKFAAKYDTVSLLNLTASALYQLASGWSADRLSPEAIEAILSEAKDKLVDAERVDAIANDIESAKLERELAEEEAAGAATGMAERVAERAAADQEAAEAEKILDGPPPDLPPLSPDPTPVPLPKPASASSDLPDDARIEFQKLVASLKRLAAKPAARFMGAVDNADLVIVMDFLNAVAKPAPITVSQKAEADNAVPADASAEVMRKKLDALDQANDAPAVSPGADDLDVRTFQGGVLAAVTGKRRSKSEPDAA